MNPHQQNLELVHRYMEGTATTEETRALEEALRTDAAFRRKFLRYANVDAALGSGRLSAAPVASPAQVPPRSAQFSWLSWRPLMAAAACVLLVGIISLLVVQRRGAPDAILRFEDQGAQGKVSIIREDRVLDASSFTSLREQDIAVVSNAGPPATLLLDRGATRLTLQPGVRLRLIALTPQKVFQLDAGSLNAEVARQPLNAPMLIQTPHAEAQVLGTAFSLTARQDQTGLTVAHGVVRISQPDGSVEDVKTGQSAVAFKGWPVRLVPTRAAIMPVSERPSVNWIKGPASWLPDGTIHFDFEKDEQDWILTKGTRWEAPGVLRLHQATRGPGGKYKAVAPAIPVTGRQHITITGKAKVENGARLEINYYQRDAEHRFFGYARVPGDFTTHEGEGFVTFRFEFDTIASDELRYIAPILYCYHADRTDPQPGDAIVIDELTFSRR